MRYFFFMCKIIVYFAQFFEIVASVKINYNETYSYN